jgi:tetratricopeptide (TPR) repeat protein
MKPNHVELEGFFRDLAHAQAAEADLAEPERSIREDLDRQRDILVGHHLQYASFQWRLAALLQRRDDLPGAEALMRQALATREKLLGPGHPDLVVGLNDLGMLVSRRGDLGESEALLRRAMDVCEEAAGERHPRFATVLNNLALVLQQRGDLAGAEPLFRQALELRRDVLGEGHPDFATSLSSLGLLHQKGGDLDRAGLMYREALGVRRRTLGEHHPLTIQVLFELLMISWGRRDWRRADDQMIEILASLEAAHGDRHPIFATSLSLRAVILRRLDDMDGAERLLRRALAVRKEALGVNHPLYANSLRSLALLFRRRKERAFGPASQKPGTAARLPASSGVRLDSPADGVGPGTDPLDHVLEVPAEARGGAASRDDPAFVEDGAPEAHSAPSPDPEIIPTRAEAAEVPTSARIRDVVNPPVAAKYPPVPDPHEPDGAKARRRGSLTMDPSSVDLSRDLVALGEVLAGLGERFLLAASEFHHPGSFPEPALLDEVAARRLEFDSLRDRSLRKAESLGVAAPPPEDLDSVRGVARLLDALSLEEAKRESLGSARSRARGILEGVQRLVYLGPTPLAALAECQVLARALEEALDVEDHGSDLSDDVRSLADDEHPLAGLLHLVQRREELGVDEWAEMYDRVSSAFGKTLAAAVAMSRVGLPPEEDRAVEADAAGTNHGPPGPDGEAADNAAAMAHSHAANL